ncbi:MAG TPA: AbrB/MazE/SpoVT family DNA-binding domain-containing protein [Bryobacteraceae bacterium]|jgi:AbrB family looped-hinge helix DNA binding protein|nr:AbrB/MazE/SpoVT family DNA-binding domain-containing protein [Bryobacteraceae bacterium]
MTDVKTYALRLEQSGRILLPAELRKKLGLTPGEDVILNVDDDGVTLAGSRLAVVRQIQERLRPYLQGSSVVDELLAERRAEGKAEDLE